VITHLNPDPSAEPIEELSTGSGASMDDAASYISSGPNPYTAIAAMIDMSFWWYCSSSTEAMPGHFLQAPHLLHSEHLAHGWHGAHGAHLWSDLFGSE
jgi:hypothetical protein